MLRKRLLHFAVVPVLLLAAIVLPATAASADVSDPPSPTLLKGFGSGRCVDDPGPQTANSVQMDIYTCIDTALNEEWAFFPVPNLPGEFRIVNQYSGKCLNVKGDLGGNNVPIIQYTCSGATNSQWRLQALDSTWFYIISESSGNCLTVQNNGTTNNSKLLQYDCNLGSNQMWRFSDAY